MLSRSGNTCCVYTAGGGDQKMGVWYLNIVTTNKVESRYYKMRWLTFLTFTCQGKHFVRIKLNLSITYVSICIYKFMEIYPKVETIQPKMISTVYSLNSKVSSPSRKMSAKRVRDVY